MTDVSVIIPTYNASDTIERALESVRAQDKAPFEVVVVDDASADDTLEKVRAFPIENLRVIALEKNLGPGGARNAGLREAKCGVVAFLDADDVWRPEKLRLQAELMESDPELVIVTCDSIYLTPDGVFKRRSHDVLPPASGPQGWKVLLAYNYMPTPTVMARREKLLAVGGFQDFDFGEDLDMWIRASLHGSVGVVHEVLVEITEWSGSLTGTIRHTQPDFVLPYIERYLEQEKARLTTRESRVIRGKRFYESGTVLFYSGHCFRSLKYFAWAALMREKPLKSVLFFPKAVLSLLTAGRYPGTTH